LIWDISHCNLQGCGSFGFVGSPDLYDILSVGGIGFFMVETYAMREIPFDHETQKPICDISPLSWL